MTGETGTLGGETVEATLLEAGIIEPTADGADHRIAADVRDAFDHEFYRMANPNAERERLQALLGDAVEAPGRDDESFEAEETDDGFVLDRGDCRIGRWPSRLAFRTDLALAGVLAERIDEWPNLRTDRRGTVLSGARLFLESCPACSEPLSVRVSTIETGKNIDDAEDTREASREVAILACDDCDDALFVGDQAA